MPTGAKLPQVASCLRPVRRPRATVLRGVATRHHIATAPAPLAHAALAELRRSSRREKTAGWQPLSLLACNVLTVAIEEARTFASDIALQPRNVQSGPRIISGARAMWPLLQPSHAYSRRRTPHTLLRAARTLRCSCFAETSRNAMVYVVVSRRTQPVCASSHSPRVLTARPRPPWEPVHRTDFIHGRCVQNVESVEESHEQRARRSPFPPSPYCTYL